MPNKVKVILGSLAGTVLEFYDFVLFGVFTPVFSSLFFPKHIPELALLMSLGILAVGFLMRPVGGVLFGYIGDKYGRQKAFRISLVLIGVPTFIIGVLPTYEQVGLASPLVLLLCRLLQGLAVGGENTGAAIFLIEHSPRGKRGFYGAILYSGVAFGALLAMGTGAITLGDRMPSWAWRLPFVSGLFILVVSMYIRYALSETPEYQAMRKQRKPIRIPLKKVILDYPYAFLSTLCVGSYTGVIAYTLTVYLNIYLSQVVLIDLSYSMLLSCLCLVSSVICGLLAGYFSDKWSSARVMKFASSLAIVAAFPIYYLLYTGELYCIILAQFLVGVLAGTYNGPMNAYMNSLFPVEIRYTGIAFGYSLGMAIFGGITPLVSTYLIQTTQNPYAPSFYLVVGAFVGLMALYMGEFRMLLGKFFLRGFSSAQKSPQ